MNIFKALSLGSGRLDERNLSSMLGFLLKPTEAHGLHDTFLRAFLRCVADHSKDKKRFDNVLGIPNNLLEADIALEVAYPVNGRKRSIDVEIRISDTKATSYDDAPRVIHCIAVENKIRPQSADKDQFKEEFTALKSDIEEDRIPALTMVFLTPPGYSNLLDREFDNLDEGTLGIYEKARVRWCGEESDERHVVGILKGVLRRELSAESEPISDYVRHSMKAFVRHILESNAGWDLQSGGGKRVADLGDLKKSIQVELHTGTYRVNRYKTNAIRVQDLNSLEIVKAKPVLRDIITEKQLQIPLLDGGKLKTTNQLGRDVIAAVEKLNLASEHL